MAGSLRLTTLGEFTIQHNNEPVSGLASRKAEALLVYLAVTRQTHSREQLATMLWDDRPLDRSLANLSVLISSLKKKLGEFLAIERSSLALAAEGAVWVDCHHLLDQLPAAGAPARPDTLAAAGEALRLYRGGFLQGFHLRQARGFDEWAALERERLQRAALDGFRWLGEGCRRLGRPREAIDAWSRSLAIDPLQESIQRELMRALALSGREGEALAQYRACARVLKTELEVEPAQPTRQLHDRILARRDRPPALLPPLPTETIGRQAEIEQVKALLLEPTTRLLTLVGAGGIGKTRLALAAASQLTGSFLEGVWLVDLAATDDPGLVPAAIARALAMPHRTEGGDGARVEGALTSRLIEFLQDKELLLVLDNCEHLLAGCAALCGRLVHECPGLKLLVTSRQRFDLADERLLPLAPLALPSEDSIQQGDPRELRLNESIQLFEQAARAVRPGFQVTVDNGRLVAAICRRLDGIPLALELAASRLRSLSLNQLDERLAQSLAEIGRQPAAPGRHQTLEKAIQWSYRLLTPVEARVFRLATVFRGGFDRRALGAIAGDLKLDPDQAADALSQLVEKSLVLVREAGAGGSRYNLLEPIRQFGLELLKSDPEYEPALDAHAGYFLALAEQHGPRLHGRQRKASLAALEPEADNLRAALQRHIQCRRSALCLRFAHALWEGYWLNQGAFFEGRRWIDNVLAVSDGSRGYHYGSALLARGAFDWTLGQLDDSVEQISKALAYAREIGDLSLLQWTHYWKAIVIYDRSEFDEAGRLLERGADYARQAGEPRGLAWCTFYQAQIARIKGQTELAIRLYQESLATLEELDVFGAGWCYIYLGHLATEQGHYHQARQYLEQSRAIYQDLDNPRGLGGTERGLGLVELEQGDLAAAEAHLRRSRLLFDQLGWIKMASSSKVYLGFIAAVQGRTEEANELLLESLAYQEREKDLHTIAHLLLVLALLAARIEQPAAASALLQAGRGLQSQMGIALPPHLETALAEIEIAAPAAGAGASNPAPDWQWCVDRVLAAGDAWPQALTDGN